MSRHSAYHITLTPKEQHILEAWQRSTTLPWGVARRAQLILALAAGMTITDAAMVAGISRQNAYVWIKRFVWLRSGSAGLHDRQRGRRKYLH